MAARAPWLAPQGASFSPHASSTPRPRHPAPPPSGTLLPRSLSGGPKAGRGWGKRGAPRPSPGPLTGVGELRLLSSRNSSRVTISLLGEAGQGRPPAWGWAAPLFWTPSWGRGPFRGGGYSWWLRAVRPGVLASHGRVAASLLGIRSSLLKLSDLPWSWSDEPGWWGGAGRYRGTHLSLSPRLTCLWGRGAGRSVLPCIHQQREPGRTSPKLGF